MKILFCGDFLMDSEQLQRLQLTWIQGMLTRPLRKAAGLEPGRFLGTDHGIEGLNRSEFFQRSGLAFDAESKFLPFIIEDLSEASQSLLESHFKPDTLLVAYELSVPTRQLLERLRIPYIDFWLHPVRFMDDLLFGFYASDPSIYQEMLPFEIDPDLFWLYADRVKTAFSMQHLLPDLVPGSALFAGQTLSDKAVLQGKRMLNVLNFQAEFKALCHTHPKVYYSKHPYQSLGDDEILRFLAEFENVELCRYPAYQLLASECIKRVMTVSSSIGIEAKYFDKQTDILYKPVINLGNRHELLEYVSIFQEFVSPHFWSRILKPLIPTRPCSRIAFLEPKDKLRDMLDWQFSYRVIDKLEAMRLQVEDQRLQLEELGLRQAYRDLLSEVLRKGHRDVVICGAGKAGHLAAREARISGLNLVAVSDRNPLLRGTLIEGAPVLSLTEALQVWNVCVIGSTIFQTRIEEEIALTAKRLGMEAPIIFHLRQSVE
jgi:hypothetical protein